MLKHVTYLDRKDLEEDDSFFPINRHYHDKQISTGQESYITD